MPSQRLYTQTGVQWKETSLGNPTTADVQLKTAALSQLEIENFDAAKSEEQWEKMWTHREERKEESLQARRPNKDDGRRTRQRKGKPN